MSIDLFCGCGRMLYDYRERVSGVCTRCLDDNGSVEPVAPAAAEHVMREEAGSTDPVTRRLIDDALKTHGKNECPKCWNPGRFIRMALVCPKHGVFGGA
jgi:hypothetical protein